MNFLPPVSDLPSLAMVVFCCLCIPAIIITMTICCNFLFCSIFDSNFAMCRLYDESRDGCTQPHTNTYERVYTSPNIKPVILVCGLRSHLFSQIPRIQPIVSFLIYLLLISSRI